MHVLPEHYDIVGMNDLLIKDRYLSSLGIICANLGTLKGVFRS